MTADEIKYYLLDRLDEIDAMNAFSRSLSSFACYAWIIDVVSHIVYEMENGKLNDEGVRFKKFVGSYMQQYNPTDLYECFRCGLIHACSLNDKLDQEVGGNPKMKPSKYYLSHNADYSRKNAKKPKMIQITGGTTQVLYYKDLSGDIRAAINNAFQKEDIRLAAEKIVRAQPLVNGVSEPKIEKKFGSSFTQTPSISGNMLSCS